MSLGTMEFTAKADIKDLEQKLNTGAKKIEDFGKKAGASIDNLGTSVKRLAPALDKSKNSINTAGQSLTNLGRIAQDVPFGFIGIQNNLNPLLESFQRLKAETGSTGGALKALAGSLVGAGGLGLALSLVTAAITIFTQANQGASKDVKETKEKVDEAGEAIKRYDQAITSASNSTIGQQGKLIELNRLLADTTNNYNNVTKAVLNQAVAQFLSTQKEGVLKNILDAKIKQTLQYKNVLGGVREFSKDILSKDPLKKAVAEGEADLKIVNDLVKNLGLDSPFKDLFKLDPSKKEKVKKDVETVSDLLALLRLQIKELNIEENIFNEDKGKERASAFLSTIKELATKFKLDPNGKLIQGLFDETKFAKAGFVLENGFLKMGVNAAKKFKEGFDTQPPTEKVDGTTNIKQVDSFSAQLKEGIQNRLSDLKIGFNKNDTIEKLTKVLKAAEEKAMEMAQAVNSIAQSSIQGIAGGIGEGIGNALGGKGGLGAIFSGIFQSLGNGLKELGRYLIKTYLLVELVKKIKFSNPALGVAAGVALIALGAFVQAKVSKTPAFANGVRNFGGGVALVGERGPELVNLPRGADVIPNNQLGGRIGGGSGDMNVSGQFIVRGTDLVAVLNKSNDRINRNS